MLSSFILYAPSLWLTDSTAFLADDIRVFTVRCLMAFRNHRLHIVLKQKDIQARVEQAMLRSRTPFSSPVDGLPDVAERIFHMEVFVNVIVLYTSSPVGVVGLRRRVIDKKENGRRHDSCDVLPLCGVSQALQRITITCAK